MGLRSNLQIHQKTRICQIIDGCAHLPSLEGRIKRRRGGTSHHDLHIPHELKIGMLVTVPQLAISVGVNRAAPWVSQYIGTTSFMLALLTMSSAISEHRFDPSDSMFSSAVCCAWIAPEPVCVGCTTRA